MEIDRYGARTPGERYGFGHCFLEAAEDGSKMWELGAFPNLKRWLHTSREAVSDDGAFEDGNDDDEFGDWCWRLPDCDQVTTSWRDMPDVDLVDFSVQLPDGGSKVVALHVLGGKKGEGPSIRFYDLVSRFYKEDVVVGAKLQELVDHAGELTGALESYAARVLEETNALNSDAAENYNRMGDIMEEIKWNGGFTEIARSKFVGVTKALVSRWATERESTAAAKLAANLLFNKPEEHWDPRVFEDAMEPDEDEDVKQSRLLAMAGMAFYKGVTRALENRSRRKAFASWKADALAPAKMFCNAVGVSSEAVDNVVSRAVLGAAPMAAWVADTLAKNGTDAVKVMAAVAAGGAVTASLVAAAGLALDWYYADVGRKKLGPVRVSTEVDWSRINVVDRAKELFAVGASVSDNTYDCVAHTQAARLDPFFFVIRREVSQLKDDGAAMRMLTNAVLPPLLQHISTTNKTVIALPATISEESARHIQEAMPEFYFRIVNRSHSHPELWAVRRGFEMIVARQLVAEGRCPNVVMVGGNVRQVSKIPGVVVNYGPVVTGRDGFRHASKGTRAQRALFNALNVDVRYEHGRKSVEGSVAVAFYSAQDIGKQRFIESMIRQGTSKAYVAVNIPVVMMDHRVRAWDDHVLNCRFEAEGDVLAMAPLGAPVAGYHNSLASTLSWVRPHRPVYGYDATVSVVSQVGSSYLLEVDVGCGPQEGHTTVWKMPDAGHYVLHDLTRDSAVVRYYTVPASKFDMVVKFVVQLSGAKNVIEATAGRILGLEAQIKIGGVVLDRAWNMTHREFVSTMVHAISCAGLAKGDSVAMLGRLRSHFSEPHVAGWWGSAKRGYLKLLGAQKDVRIPGVANRGASDFDPVTHWKCVQPSGVGFASEKFSPIRFLPEGVEAKKGGDEDGKVEDEGYASAESLGAEDAADCSDSGDSREGSSGETSEPKEKRQDTIFEVLSRAAKSKFSGRREAKSGEASSPRKFGGFVPTSKTMGLVVHADEVASLVTSSVFDPTGVPDYGVLGGSKCNNRCMELVAGDGDLVEYAKGGQELPAPDRGMAHVINLFFLEAASLCMEPSTLVRWVRGGEPVGPMEELQDEFFGELTDERSVAAPFLLVDGISGAAKSSAVRQFLRDWSVSAAIVTPTRRLAREWRSHRVGTTVTKHKLRLATLRGRSLLVVDECYAYTSAEMHALLWKAARSNVKVLLLGDRKQQYEDGSELVPETFAFMGVPVVRMCVSNTMPVDALKVAIWSSDSDPAAQLFQTRNSVVHSIRVVQKDDAGHVDQVKDAVASSNCLVFKDRLGPMMHYTSLTDAELGFVEGKEDDWLSTSRTQGLRTDHSLMVTSRFTKSEKWFVDQPGLFYVAVSRHSKTMMAVMEQSEMSLFKGLIFDEMITVEGRLAKRQRERFDAPMLVVNALHVKQSEMSLVMAQRGAKPQSFRFDGVGPIREDWRPWHRFASGDPSVAESVFRASALNLVGEQVPYTQTGAVTKPTYQAAMGLFSVRRPNLCEPELLRTKFLGLDRLAVLQYSKDELLDQKNVIERTARPRVIVEDEGRIESDSTALFGAMLGIFFDQTKRVPLSVEPSASEWEASRSADFVPKFVGSDAYATTGFSTRSQGFLKTQTKVKLKKTFAQEENYGQTVLASQPDFNAIFGPWSKLLLRNLRLLTRPGVVLDSGFSDKELAREFRRLGVLPRFEEENYQADVKRQDTSHTPVTLRVFCKVMAFCGVPEELCSLYELHSRRFDYQSMHQGLYRGEARYNLGSGDPFTLIRNIVEVMTVMTERFGQELADVCMVIKGDDFLADRVMPVLPVTVAEVRATQLTEDFMKPPYHAGRFFLDDDVVPDPVRMVTKILVKESDTVERVNQLAESFYDRYVHLTDLSYQKMRRFVVEAYSDFEPEFPLASLDLYHALRDRNLFYELLSSANMDDSAKLVVLDSDEDCAPYAASFFCEDPEFLRTLEHESLEVVEYLLNSRNVPNYRVKGRPNDLLKRGVWLSSDHAWAVIGLTEYKEKVGDDEDARSRHKRLQSLECRRSLGGFVAQE